MTIAFLILAFTSAAVLHVCDGLYHGLIYGRAGSVPALRYWNENIHRIAQIVDVAIYAGLTAPLCALLWLTGHGWWGVASALVSVKAGFVFGGFWRQVAINLGSGLPAIDPHENSRKEVYSWFWIPKVFCGRRRWAAIPIALLMLAVCIWWVR